MMGLSQFHQFFMILVVFLSILAGIFSASISDGIFSGDAGTGRNLLQAKKSCPVNFEFQNYTIITSQCKGPQYLPKLCCPAFKEFSCPFADDLNDLTNDCATTMFSYINLYGKYPPGLFASLCREGKEGLECPAPSPSESENVSGSLITGEVSNSENNEIERSAFDDDVMCFMNSNCDERLFFMFIRS